MEAIGWIGNFLLATCSLPLAYDAWRHKESRVSLSFLLFWGVGELFACIYAFTLHGSAPLILNYAVNLVGISAVLRFAYWPDRRTSL